MSFVRIRDTYYNLTKIKVASLCENWGYTIGISNPNYDPEFKHSEDNPWSFDCRDKHCRCCKDISEERVSNRIDLKFFDVLEKENPEEYHVVLQHLYQNAI
jgi:hypothetical protein